MSLLKSLQRNLAAAQDFAHCVRENQPYRLLDVKAYLTRRCNLQCVMCDAWTARDRCDELDTEDWLRVITQARQLGLCNLKLFGGEPTLRQDLATIVEHAFRLGVRCALVTNGTLLTKERARALVQAGLQELDLSLDASNPTLHDSIRGMPGAWSRAVQGLQAMRQAARSYSAQLHIRVNAVVMRENWQDMPGLMSVLSDLGVDEIALNPVVPRGNDRQHALQRQDILRYNAEIAPRIAERAAAYRLSRYRDELYIYGTGESDVEQAARCQYIDRLHVSCCFKPWYYMVVRENGDVIGCNTVKHPLARIGNVRQASLDQIWSSAAYAAFRASCQPPQFAECVSCCYRFALVNQHIGQTILQGAQDTT